MPLRAADFESAAYAIPPLRAGPKCRRRCHRPRRRLNLAGTSTHRGVCAGTDARLDRLGIAVRRRPNRPWQDLRSTTVPDEPVQRRDLILLERARGCDLDAFNDLVVLTRIS